MSGKKNKRGIQIVAWKAKARMKNELSKAQIDEFHRLDPGEDDGTTDARTREDPRAPTGIKQLTNWNTLQSAEEVVRVSREFYLPKAPALGCS